MKKVTFNAHNALSQIFEPGAYVCKIDSVELTEANASDEYKDRTPQLKVTFRNADGLISHWYNLQGYEVDAKGILIIKDGKRIIDPVKTGKAQSIVGRLGLDAGIAKGEDFEMEDLAGLDVGIFVGTTDQGNSRVQYSMKPERALEKAEELASNDGAFE